MKSVNASSITDKDIEIFIQWPHLFGHYLGYNKLLPLHGEWIKRAYYYRSLKSLQAHRGSYKTTAFVIVGAIWYLLFINPSETIGTFRKSDAEAQKIGKTVKEHFESKEVMSIVRHIYGPKVKTLKTSTWSNSSLTLSISRSKAPEGNFEARGTSGSITGSHYNILIPDDIITLRDRTSKAEREGTFDIIRELHANVLNPGGLWLPSGTPWHKDDGWKILPEPERYPIGSIALPHITPEFIAEKKRETSQSLYAANYLLEHIASEDALFNDPLRAPWPEKPQIITAWLDPSYSGDNMTALAMYAGKNGKHHVRGWVWPDSVEMCYDRIVNLMKQHNAGTLYVEANADKGFSARDLGLRWPAVVKRDESMNKHIKIVSFLKKNWHQIYFADDCQDEFLNLILDYIEGQEPDDPPDALAALLREMKIYDQSETLARRFGI